MSPKTLSGPLVLIDPLTTAKTRPPTLASVAPDAHVAANDSHQWPVDHDTVNPLWMITVALGILIGVMALLVATS